MKKVALVLACAVAVLQVADAGLLRVPKVYNALITTNEKILPSRAIPLSAPVFHPLAVPIAPLPVVVSSPYLSVEPEEGPSSTARPAENGATTVTPPENSEGATEPPPDATSTKKPGVLAGPAGQILAPLAVPFSYYSPLSYTAFSYYPSFVSYTYPLDYNSYGLPIPFVGHGLEIGKEAGDSKKDKEDRGDKIPDVPPPPPPSGAASDDNDDSVAVDAA